jgi:hypothetical protein
MLLVQRKLDKESFAGGRRMTAPPAASAAMPPRLSWPTAVAVGHPVNVCDLNQRKSALCNFASA